MHLSTLHSTLYNLSYWKSVVKWTTVLSVETKEFILTRVILFHTAEKAKAVPLHVTKALGAEEV
jgi:hypothetical protein